MSKQKKSKFKSIPKQKEKHEDKQDKKINTLWRELMPLKETKVNYFYQSIDNVPGQNATGPVNTELSVNTQGVLGEGNLTAATTTMRIGSSAVLKGFDVNFSISYTEVQPNYFRVIIFKSYYPIVNVAAVAATDILQSFSGANNSMLGLNSTYNINYVRNKGMIQTKKNIYSILVDKKVYFGGRVISGASYAVQNEKQTFRIKKRFKKGILLNATGNNDSGQNVVMMILPGASTNAALNPFYTYWGRVLFNDM